MPFGTMGLLRVSGSYPNPPHDIPNKSNWFEVRGVYATYIPAEMVNGQATANRAYKQRISKPMCID